MSVIDFETGLSIARGHLDELENSGSAALILIDGRAGSGKSRFAKLLSESFFREHRFLPRLISMDDLYPGWNGLRDGSVYLLEHILGPLAAGREASWQVGNWEQAGRGRDEPGNGMRSLQPGNPLIAEGCGSLSKETSPLATLRIWIESDTQVRRERYSERDGGKFDELFGIWAAQEDEFYAEQQSAFLADVLITN